MLGVKCIAKKCTIFSRGRKSTLTLECMLSLWQNGLHIQHVNLWFIMSFQTQLAMLISNAKCLHCDSRFREPNTSTQMQSKENIRLVVKIPPLSLKLADTTVGNWAVWEVSKSKSPFSRATQKAPRQALDLGLSQTRRPSREGAIQALKGESLMVQSSMTGIHGMKSSAIKHFSVLENSSVKVCVIFGQDAGNWTQNCCSPQHQCPSLMSSWWVPGWNWVSVYASLDHRGSLKMLGYLFYNPGSLKKRMGLQPVWIHWHHCRVNYHWLRLTWLKENQSYVVKVVI